MIKFQPVIKWSGSKRSQVELILSEFPNKINTYYEPFLGGGSILIGLILSEIKVDKYIVSDLNNDLISLWLEIKNNPTKVADEYEKMWNELNSNADKQFKKEYFYMVRERFNKNKSPYDFMFIMRVTTNGMPRYNKSGEFNNSFHVTRDGIQPEKLRKVIIFWSEMLNKHDVEFLNCSYDEIKPMDGDFVYLDPPYANTKGMYYGGLDNEKLFDWLRTLDCQYTMSFDGISGDIDNTFSVPKDVYSEHKYLKSGNSSFKRTIGKSNNSIVYESLYIKR